MKRSLWCLLAFLCCGVEGWGAVAFVQEKDAHWFSSSGTTETLTFASNVSANNLVVCDVAYFSTQAVSTFQDGNSTNLTVIDTDNDGAGHIHATYYLISSGGTATITVTWGADPGAGNLQCHEASGIATSSTLDVHQCNNQTNPGTGTDAVTSGSLTTTGADYVFAATFDANGNAVTWSAGTGLTAPGTNTNALWFYNEYLVQGASGSVAGTFTSNTAGVLSRTCIATFKASGGGSTPTCKRKRLGVGC